MITVDGLTMKYRNGRGIFDVSFSIEEGEVFGYLVPNGAGKTTTVKLLTGLLREKQPPSATFLALSNQTEVHVQ